MSCSTRGAGSGSATPQFATATCGTIRLKLLKIGAQVRRSVRRIKNAMASALLWRVDRLLAVVDDDRVERTEPVLEPILREEPFRVGLVLEHVLDRLALVLSKRNEIGAQSTPFGGCTLVAQRFEPVCKPLCKAKRGALHTSVPSIRLGHWCVHAVADRCTPLMACLFP
jgi:hypothetical protein